MKYRNSRGQYTSKRSMMAVTLLTALLLTLTVIAIDKRVETIKDETVQYVYIEDSKLQSKIEQLENELLTDLRNCESGGYDEDTRNSLIIYDSNKKMSIGSYQLQRETIQDIYKRFKKQDIDRVEAIKLAIDPDRAKEFTRFVLLETPNGYLHWENCANKINAKSRVETIKKLLE